VRDQLRKGIQGRVIDHLQKNIQGRVKDQLRKGIQGRVIRNTGESDKTAENNTGESDKTAENNTGVLLPENLRAHLQLSV
jgi:hypothetical protein